MRMDRRRLLAAGSATLAACATGSRRADEMPAAQLDRLLAAHADALPERAGAGANHYPMAAEVLEALGYEHAIEDDWFDGAALYAGVAGRARPIHNQADFARALGDYERFGDWLDFFRAELARGTWQTTVARWAPRFAPAISAAAFHGVIRTGHAVRALGARDTTARRHELAVGLAYWAARYIELPTTPRADGRADLFEVLPALKHPFVEDGADVGFYDVLSRLTETAIAPPPIRSASWVDPRRDLERVVHAAAIGFLEMLAQERSRLWLLHTITGPAALDWLLPHVAEPDGRRLVAYARQAVVGMVAAYGARYVPRAHVRTAPGAWPELIERAVATRSVHGIKLMDALKRFDHDGDPLWRSIGAEWLAWV